MTVTNTTIPILLLSNNMAGIGPLIGFILFFFTLLINIPITVLFRYFCGQWSCFGEDYIMILFPTTLISMCIYIFIFIIYCLI